MSNDFVALGIQMGIAAFLALALVVGVSYLGPKKNTPYKSSPYECGVAPLGDADERFPIKFYLVAILFVLFDIEVVFLWGWLSVFASASLNFKIFSFGEVLVYLFTWIVGYAYVIKIGALEWDDSIIIPAEHLGLPDEFKEAS